jgi:hypothetical protein
MKSGPFPPISRSAKSLPVRESPRLPARSVTGPGKTRPDPYPPRALRMCDIPPDQADFLWGGRGDDVLRAVDQLADRRIDGDGGRDTAYFDRGRDVPVQCEVRLARPR